MPAKGQREQLPTTADHHFPGLLFVRTVRPHPFCQCRTDRHFHRRRSCQACARFIPRGELGDCIWSVSYRFLIPLLVEIYEQTPPFRDGTSYRYYGQYSRSACVRDSCGKPMPLLARWGHLHAAVSLRRNHPRRALRTAGGGEPKRATRDGIRGCSRSGR